MVNGCKSLLRMAECSLEWSLRTQSPMSKCKLLGELWCFACKPPPLLQESLLIQTPMKVVFKSVASGQCPPWKSISRRRTAHWNNELISKPKQEGGTRRDQRETEAKRQTLCNQVNLSGERKWSEIVKQRDSRAGVSELWSPVERNMLLWSPSSLQLSLRPPSC